MKVQQLIENPLPIAEIDDHHTLDVNNLNVVDYSKSSMVYVYENFTAVGFFSSNAVDDGFEVRANIKFTRYHEDDSFDYTYGSEQGTHTNFKGYVIEFYDVEITAVQFTDETGKILPRASEEIVKGFKSMDAIKSAIKDGLLNYLDGLSEQFNRLCDKHDDNR